MDDSKQDELQTKPVVNSVPEKAHSPPFIPNEEEFEQIVLDSSVIRNREISGGLWARVLNGDYNGDLGQAVAVNEMNEATAKLIPRIDLQDIACKGLHDIFSSRVTPVLKNVTPHLLAPRARSTGIVG